MFKDTSWHGVSDGYEPLSSSGLTGCFRCGALGRGGKLEGGHLGRPMGRSGQGKPPRPQVYVCDHNAPSPAYLRPKVWLASGAGEAVKPAQLPWRPTAPPRRVVSTSHPPPRSLPPPRRSGTYLKALRALQSLVGGPGSGATSGSASQQVLRAHSSPAVGTLLRQAASTECAGAVRSAQAQFPSAQAQALFPSAQAQAQRPEAVVLHRLLRRKSRAFLT